MIGFNLQMIDKADVWATKFDGTNPNDWICKCGKYCKLCKIPENQMVDLTSLHMIDKAAVWATNYLALKPKVGWLLGSWI